MDQSSGDFGAGLSRTEGPGQEVGLGEGPGLGWDHGGQPAEGYAEPLGSS